MRRISNFHWLLMLAAAGLIVFTVGTASLYLKFKMPGLLPEDINDSSGAWTFGTFWVLHAPIMFILSRGFSFESSRLTKNLLVFFSTGVVWAMLIQGLPLLLVPFLNNSASYSSEQFRRLFINWSGENLLLNILICWLILSIGLISSYYEQYQKVKLKASQLDAQLSNAHLRALQMQLHPHFLFNTLHSISALALNDEVRDAVKMINRLSEFLRLTLDKTDTQIVTLADEMEFTRRYLEIERIRFQDRLTVDMDIDRQALKAQVPTLILQPLVENAMRHAIDANSGTSRIKIAAHLQGDQILMQVRDDGRDLEKISEPNNVAGLGLKNTRARLAELYGEDYRFSLHRAGDDWTVAEIVIPFSSAGLPATGGSD